MLSILLISNHASSDEYQKDGMKCRVYSCNLIMRTAVSMKSMVCSAEYMDNIKSCGQRRVSTGWCVVLSILITSNNVSRSEYREDDK